ELRRPGRAKAGRGARRDSRLPAKPRVQMRTYGASDILPNAEGNDACTTEFPFGRIHHTANPIWAASFAYVIYTFEVSRREQRRGVRTLCPRSADTSNW